VSGPGVALSAALLAAVLAMATLARPVLRALPEPEAEPGDEAMAAAVAAKPPYADLPTTRFVATCSVLAALAVVVAALTLPGPVQPMWWVLAVPALLLAAVDARTTWVSTYLVWACWLAMAAAALLAVPLGGGAFLLFRVGVGASVAAGLFWLARLVSRRDFGKGDVWFAPLVGAAAAAVDWTMLIWALLLGTVVGGVHAAVLLARRRRGGLAYVPSILAGAYLACALRWLDR
jgi:leader peptidase (prepilin peptidase)/N-methyltransferase